MKRKVSPILALVVAMIAFSLPACSKTQAGEHEAPHEEHQIIVTNPEAKEVTITRSYVCQIHSRRHIEIRALDEGYLEAITVREGQAVKAGDVMFKVLPVLYKARYEAEKAEVNYAAVKLENTRLLHKQNVVSDVQVALDAAELAKAEAKMKLAEAELNFAYIKAPFDGIMDRQYFQHGSLVKKDDVLTTLSDNGVMWVYFNVPEARYLEYKEHEGKSTDPSKLTLVDSQIKLKLANGNMFKYSADNTVTVEGNFNNRTGNIPFRADIKNPDGLLRHGQTGTVLIDTLLKNALVIPQRATFEFLDKQYVWVVGEDNVVHRRLITVQHELEDEFVIKTGLDVKDKIIVEGVRQVHDGDKIEYELRKPAEILKHQKNPAE